MPDLVELGRDQEDRRARVARLSFDEKLQWLVEAQHVLFHLRRGDPQGAYFGTVGAVALDQAGTDRREIQVRSQRRRERLVGDEPGQRTGDGASAFAQVHTGRNPDHPSEPRNIALLNSLNSFGRKLVRVLDRLGTQLRPGSANRGRNDECDDKRCECFDHRAPRTLAAAADLLDQADLPQNLRRQFVAVRRSVEYLQQLSDGLHLLALDPEDAEASGASTNLAEWEGQVGSLLVKAVPKHVVFQCDLPADLPPIAAPPHRLTQAVLNLVVNAGEAVSEEGIVRIWARRDSESDAVLLGVTDNGEGMTPEVKKHALDPFFTTKERGLGTGLGLSLVRGVVQAAGGSIEIESERGEGITVALRIPPAGGGLDDAGEEAQRPLAAVSIDDPRAATFVSAILGAGGFDVMRADGEPPAEARLWVLDPRRAKARAAQRFLDRAEHGTLLLFGAPPQGWTGGGHDLAAAPHIADPNDFELIREMIGRVMLAELERTT